ncbi:MSMEG_0565 family glycosyltransferase [Uliginosibacterium sp. H1]|uniref:MSMEG_0565 family glycosyltransferase n=1 Tax=Uliginosibacterium sp. H1 TaxID=3114757 RepID=UPI002E198597|nr:MSMEG_0565 family glycosyltransferase [Uliginosibacterium sp. H1]
MQPETPSLRIALLTHSINPRGGVVHTLELGQALHEAGHQVTLLAPARPGERFFRDTPCEVSLVPIGATPASVVDMVAQRIAAYVAHLTALLAHRELEHFDILHAQDSISGNALAVLKQQGVIPHFVRTVHHLDDFADPQLAQWQRIAWQEADRVLCVSRLWCEAMARDHGVQPQQVGNGVDAVRFSVEAKPGDAEVRQRLGLRDGDAVVLSVGGVEARKNSLRLLQAFMQLRARVPTARLVIAGGASLLDHDDYQHAFREALATSALPPDAVLLTGPLADADMPAVFRSASVLAMPSLREGFGLVVLEALASGVPVVVSRIAPFTEHLDDSLGQWADPQSVDSIAQALQAALGAPRGKALRMRAAGLLDRYAWSRSAQRHVEIYRGHLERAATMNGEARVPQEVQA